MSSAARPSVKAPALPAPLDLAVFRQMADMSNDAFYLTDSRGRFLYVNGRSVTLGGYTRDELLRMSVSDINPEYPPERFQDFAAAMAAGTAPPRFETVSRRRDGTIFPIEISVAQIAAGGETYFFGLVRDITERKQMEAAHKAFAQRMLETLEAERRRVARELHDDVGQAIATIGVLLRTLERTPGSIPEEARAALAATRATIAQITEAVAGIVRDFHPTELLGLGLEDSLRTHARQFAERHGLSLRLATAPVVGLLSREDELHLYRIVQEALANVARHARARRVAVRLACARHRVVVSVHDDGCGFAPRTRTTGLGLITMRERAALMRAELALRSAPGRGTAVRVAVPLRTGAAPR